MEDSSSNPSRGGGGSGRRRGGGGSRRGRGDRGSGRRSDAPVDRDSHQQPSGQQTLVNRPSAQVNRPPSQDPSGRPVSPQQPGPTPVQPQTQPLPPAAQHASADDIDFKKLKISEEKPQENQTQVMRRPGCGTLMLKPIKLAVNHFLVTFNPEMVIIHYDVDVKPCNDNGSLKKKLRKSEMAFIKNKLFSSNAELFASALDKTVYDAEKNIFSAVCLPVGVFSVDIPEGEDVKSGSYLFTIKPVNELKLSNLNDYLTGIQPCIPRDILQGMDLVMKTNPSKRRIAVGRSFYSRGYLVDDDLYYGGAAYRGFQQSLKPTSQGLALCLDYSVIAFLKNDSVIKFLEERIQGFTVGNFKRQRRSVVEVLRGLKVTVTHRRTNQKYTVGGLTEGNARDISFDVIDPEGREPPRTTSLLDYFWNKWERKIQHPDIPCLELGNSKKSNIVPLEFCQLVEGQRYPKEYLPEKAGTLLRNLSLATPGDRRTAINSMVNAEDGPCGLVSRNFGIEVHSEMTRVTGRVIAPPNLRLGVPQPVKVNAEKCQWNLFSKSLVDGQAIDRWALLDFTVSHEVGSRHEDGFINSLICRFKDLGIRMEEPLVYCVAKMENLSSFGTVEKLLKGVVVDAGKKNKEKLQIMVCVMPKKHDVYKYLKWVSETKIGVLTQCCLSSNVYSKKGQLQSKKGQQTLANLCLKINAKLGGSNFELVNPLPHFATGDHVMFIGADVNHPAARNSSCPSIAAVVGTVNWPAANRYAARVTPQPPRCEKIMNFGSMCLDLVNTYARFNNNVKPNRIVLFRDGVSEGQFEMVLNHELVDLEKTLYDENGYKPTITVIVAQKRHQTRLFVESSRANSERENVPPGTVVDTTIVHPHNFDFYLCSHYGSLGTSKPTHYYVLRDDNSFKSDALQKLIYDMCFTFVRCTKPVSLVPPVYYADLAAYRGRMFQEVLLKRGSASFNQSFYELHSDLKDVMFFV